MIDELNRTITRRSGLRGASFLVMLFAVGAVISGCSHSGHDADGSSGGNSATFDSTAMKSSDVVASVNSDPITAGELFDGMEHYVPAGLPGFPNNLQLSQQAGRIVLQDLIVNKLKLQIASGDNVPVTSANLDQSFQDYQYTQQMQLAMPSDVYLHQQGYTEDQFKHEILAPQVAEINFLQKMVVLSPEALAQAYKDTADNYVFPAAVHVHRIICATQNQADAVAAGLKAGTPMLSFDADNIAHGNEGGDTDDDTDFANWIRTDHPLPILGAAGPALAAAKVGDIVGPYRIGGGWWVMQIIEKRPQQTPTYDQVKDLVRISYVRQMAGQSGSGSWQVAMIQNIHNSLVRINIPAYQNLSSELHEITIPDSGGSVAASGSSAGSAPQQRKQ